MLPKPFLRQRTPSPPLETMRRPLTTPRWLAAHIVALALLVLFVNLGLWQLRRLEERQLENLVGAERAAAPALDLEIAVAAAGANFESLADRHVSAAGTFDPAQEVLIRSQVEAGQAGFHVITPFRLDSGAVVLVNRGWVPLDMGSVPVLASPPLGHVDIEAIVRVDQFRPGGSQGAHPVYNRVDIKAIGRGVALPVYLALEGERSNRLPIPLPTPEFSAEGSHLFYAIQWFSFALIGVVGYLFLLRRARQTSDDLDVRDPRKDRRVDSDLRGSRARPDDYPFGSHDRLVDPDSEPIG